MQIRLTDINTGKVLNALSDNGFGLARTVCPVRHTLETVAIWSEVQDGTPGGYEIGVLRRELSSFTRHELVLETNRIETTRLMALLSVIAIENR